RHSQRVGGGSKPTTEVGSNRILPEREDCTLVAWYRSLYAPRTGGAYDSHHRTAGIAGCTRRRGGRGAAGGTGAADGDAGDWVSSRRVRRNKKKVFIYFSSKALTNLLLFKAKHCKLILFCPPTVTMNSRGPP